MADYINKYLKAKVNGQNVNVYPYTNTDAVLDENGKTLTENLEALQKALDDVESAQDDFINKDEKAAANGVATLGADGKVPLEQLPDDALSGGSANDVDYDNTTSGLTATTVQGAIDELVTAIDGNGEIPDGVTYVDFSGDVEVDAVIPIDADTLGGHSVDDFVKVTDAHEHTNKETLDKLSTSDDGTLLYNGEQIKGDGEDGVTYTPQIGTVATGDTASATIDIDEDNSTATFNFVFPTGSSDGETTLPDGIAYVNIDESEDIGEVAETIDADRLGGRLPSYYVNIDNYKDYLDVNVEADFLTEEGHGKLRFLNGVFQYYDDTTAAWVDAVVSPENVYIMNMTPNAMQSISAVYDTKLGCNKLKWEEAADTVYDGQAFCVVDSVTIRRKLGSAPTDENDGDLVIEVPRHSFGMYKSTYYIDDGVTPVAGDTYYYKAFPKSTMGYYNYATINECSATYKDYYVFGFRIDQTESDPANMITYIEENTNFSSAYMDYTADAFNYGDWTVDNGAWFMDVKPCMLKYDGTVDYYLNSNDYTLKEDCTDSDVGNTSYEGNAMIQFPKVYYKCVNISDDVAEYYFSDKKIDDDYHCWSHIDNNGSEIDYCYMPIYNGVNINSVLRSVSGQTPMNTQVAETEIACALANNQTDDVIWYTEVFADRQLINLLLLLIGKSTDTQTIFGNGKYIGGTSISALLNTGTMDNKGLFWGTNGRDSGIKVFGIEHYWGNRWSRVAGLINDNGTQKIKMTYGQSDSSTVDGYNMDGSGYISLEDCTPSGTNGGYINRMKFTKYGMNPIAASGSSSTYYPDGLWFNNSQVSYAIIGDSSSSAYGLSTGTFCLDLARLVSNSTWGIGASVSCKPLAATTIE